MLLKNLHHDLPFLLFILVIFVPTEKKAANGGSLTCLHLYRRVVFSFVMVVRFMAHFVPGFLPSVNVLFEFAEGKPWERDRRVAHGVEERAKRGRYVKQSAHPAPGEIAPGKGRMPDGSFC